MKFRWRVTAAAFVLFVIASGVQYGLATWLGSATVFSRDTDSVISLGVEAAFFLVAGFALSFLGRGYRPLENGLASLLFGVVTFFALRQLKPPSFSYDRFFASPGELVIWALSAAAGSWLLAMWGASLGMLIGAGGHVDARFRYEWGIARTHLRLTRRNVFWTAFIGLVVPGVQFVAGFAAEAWDSGVRRGTGVHALTLHPAALIVSLATIAGVLFGSARFVEHRARLANLQPGQRRKRPATVVMTAISIAGVGVGVWALTVVLSVMSGFEADL
ncbi:MAG: hypothetical protein ABR567_22860, partial [Myxococcales bacterium]